MSNINTYVVSVECEFEAETPAEALVQMVDWLGDRDARWASYRIDNVDTGEVVFLHPGDTP